MNNLKGKKKKKTIRGYRARKVTEESAFC
jgi:hypothetical protein